MCLSQWHAGCCGLISKIFNLWYWLSPSNQYSFYLFLFTDPIEFNIPSTHVKILLTIYKSKLHTSINNINCDILNNSKVITIFTCGELERKFQLWKPNLQSSGLKVNVVKIMAFVSREEYQILMSDKMVLLNMQKQIGCNFYMLYPT